MAAFRALAQDFYQPAACIHHYLQMAKRNFREYLQGETVWLKKYFYVLRPVLACLWIEQRGRDVPMAFDALLDGLVKDGELKRSIVKLTELKRSGAEMDNGLRIPVIHSFLEQEIARLMVVAANTRKIPTSSELPVKINRYFRDTLGA